MTRDPVVERMDTWDARRYEQKIQALQRALLHALQRTHGHVPGACSGCENVEKAVLEYEDAPRG